MDIINDLLCGKDRVSVIGLGYVGLQLAIEFGNKYSVIGYDTNEVKINAYKLGADPANEVHPSEFIQARVEFTTDAHLLAAARFHIIAVPTPINQDKSPNLEFIISATQTVARHLSKGSFIVYESTVYPGVTEEICIPLIEEISGLRCGIDFKVGYSPERIVPGEKRLFSNIVKVVAGIDNDALKEIAQVYGMVIGPENIYEAESIKVAEAAKVTENTQRDLNIALMNELSMIFNKMGIDSKAVINAAATKWNFIQMQPGIVGGHCISVDPYYLVYKAEQIGYAPELILSGRKTNERMASYIAEHTIKLLIDSNRRVKGCKILVIGFTYKENVADVRNTKVADIVRQLNDYGAEVYVTDVLANPYEAYYEYGISLFPFEEVNEIDAIIYAVPHQDYSTLTLKDLKKKYRTDLHEACVFIDLKGLYDKEEADQMDMLYWSL